mmetsp:Transcript_25243/g.32841  ORF Transcript_25243/g.32841 Transcript_25243/m.32841 type:complete len:498 (+) Transcript_25243:119-1612(+)
MSTTKKWLIDELKSLFGFNEVDEMANFMLAFPSNDLDGLTKYLEDLLGKNTATNRLATELNQRLVEESDSSVRVAAKKKKKNKSNNQTKQNNHFDNSQSSYIPQSSQLQAEQPIQNKFPDKKLSQKEKARMNKGNQKQMGGIKISYEGKRKTLKEQQQERQQQENGEYEIYHPPPEELILTHTATPTGAGVIVNCLSCGYINVLSSKSIKNKQYGDCSYCNAFLERGIDITSAPGFMNALSLKNRLVQYDLDSEKRHEIYDDEADYYTSAAWLSELEQEELSKRDQARHEKMHSHRRDVVVTIDIAGRRLVEEIDKDGIEAARNRYIDKKKKIEHEKERHLDNVNMLKGVTCGTPNDGGSGSSGGSSSLSASATPFNQNDEKNHQISTNKSASDDRGGTMVGMFHNDTLTGRSLDVVSSLGDMFQQLKDNQNENNKKNEKKNIKESEAASQKSVSKKGSSYINKQHKQSNSEAMSELESHLAPWRSNASSGYMKVQH